MLDFTTSLDAKVIGHSIQVGVVISEKGEEVANGKIIAAFNDKNIVKISECKDEYYEDVNMVLHEMGVFDRVIFRDPIAA